MKKDLKVAAAAGLSVYLPLYWMATTLTDACGNPEPLTAFEVVVLLLVFASYLLAPFLLSLLSRFPLAARPPRWLSIPAVGSGILVLAYVVALGVRGWPPSVEGTVGVWLGLSLWTMPASAAVCNFGAAVHRAKRWYSGPDYDALGLRR
jgi:hypothetical protein